MVEINVLNITTRSINRVIPIYVLNLILSNI